MKVNFAPQNGMHKWIGIISVVLVVIEPWVAAWQTTFGLVLAGTGLIGVSTYLEFLPFFRLNLPRRLLVVLILLGLLLIEVVYTFGVFSMVGA